MDTLSEIKIPLFLYIPLNSEKSLYTPLYSEKALLLRQGP